MPAHKGSASSKSVLPSLPAAAPLPEDETDLSAYIEDDQTNNLETLLSSSFAQHTGGAYLPSDFLNSLEGSDYTLPPPPPHSTQPSSASLAGRALNEDDIDISSDQHQPTASSSHVPIAALPDASMLDGMQDLSDEAKVLRMEQVEAIISRAVDSNQAFQTQSMRLLKQYNATIERSGDLEYLSQDLCDEVGNPPNMDIIADGLEQPCTPWFKHYHGRELPPSAESEQLHRYMQATRPLPWTKDEIAALKRRVHEEMRRLADEFSRQHPGQPFSQTISEEADAIDWDRVQSAPELRTHTDIECRLRWLNVESARINTGIWSKEEIDRLHPIVAQHGESNWPAIAAALNTGRTPVACLRQYRKKPLEKKEWVKAEDEKLREAISMFGANWQSVARHVGRTSNQCINRWTKTLRPGIKRGRWTPEEDETLKKAVEACGTVWKKVGMRVKGRTDQQCRERWANVLDPRLIKSKQWSAEEDATILRLADGEVGHQWSTISRLMGFTRTDNAIYRRFEELSKKRGTPLEKKGKRTASELTKANKAAAQAGAIKRIRRPKKSRDSEDGADEEDQLQNENVLDLVNQNIDPILHNAMDPNYIPMLADQIVKDLNQPDDASTNANDVQDVLAADEERPAKKRRQDLREEQSQAAHTESTDGTNASNQTNDENVGTQPAKATTRSGRTSKRRQK